MTRLQNFVYFAVLLLSCGQFVHAQDQPGVSPAPGVGPALDDFAKVLQAAFAGAENTSDSAEATALSETHRKLADSFNEAREFQKALEESQLAIKLAPTTPSDAKAAALVTQSRAYQGLGDAEKAQGALVMAYIMGAKDSEAASLFDHCNPNWDDLADTLDSSAKLKVARERLEGARRCYNGMLVPLRSFQSDDFQILMMTSLVPELVDSLFGGIDAMVTEVVLNRGQLDAGAFGKLAGNPMLDGLTSGLISGVVGMRGRTPEVTPKLVAQSAPALLEAANQRWEFLTLAFPTLSEPEKRDFLSHATNTAAQRLLSLAFEPDSIAAVTGLQAALLDKQLLFEASRQESAAMQASEAGAAPAWIAKKQEREKLKKRYAERALESLTGQAVDPNELSALAGNIARLEKELQQGNPNYATAARLTAITVEQLTAALRPNEALVEYVNYKPFDFAASEWGSPHYGAFVLRADGKVTAIELGEAAGIDAAVQQFRDQVQKWIRDNNGGNADAEIRNSETAIARASVALRGRVWQPLEQAVAGAGRIYLAPDSQLSLLPFEALARTDASGSWRYLVEDHEIVYLNTSRDLGRLALSAGTVTSRPKTAVLVGNPAFDAPPEELAAAMTRSAPSVVKAAIRSRAVNGGSTLGSVAAPEIPRNWRQFPALSNLILSATTQLRKLGWSVTALTDRAAVKEAVEAVEAPRILQFATHGYIMLKPNDAPGSWDNPLLRSMLIMAGVNNWHPVYRTGKSFVAEAAARAAGLNGEQLTAARAGLGDGVLTAYEVTGMNLQGTELVNLTACKTGLGEVTPDGVAGLRQAFLLAGARSLTTSMWEVPAQETTRQVQDFYTRWLATGKGAPRARYEAFRASQLDALARARQEHGSGHPFYWAGTIFVGDPGDLPTPPKTAPAAPSTAVVDGHGDIPAPVQAPAWPNSGPPTTNPDLP